MIFWNCEVSWSHYVWDMARPLISASPSLQPQILKNERFFFSDTFILILSIMHWSLIFDFDLHLINTMISKMIKATEAKIGLI